MREKPQGRLGFAQRPREGALKVPLGGRGGVRVLGGGWVTVWVHWSIVSWGDLEHGTKAGLSP